VFAVDKVAKRGLPGRIGPNPAGKTTPDQSHSFVDLPSSRLLDIPPIIPIKTFNSSIVLG
jgi:hypothetical protein